MEPVGSVLIARNNDNAVLALCASRSGLTVRELKWQEQSERACSHDRHESNVLMYVLHGAAGCAGDSGQR